MKNIRNGCCIIATLLFLLPSVHVCGQERLKTESLDYSSTEDVDRYERNVDKLLNRKGVFACVVRPSFEHEYSLLIYDDNLVVLTSNTQIWYEKYKPRSSYRTSLKVGREICTALQGLFDVAIDTRSEYADDRMIFDGVKWVFSNPEGKMASCHSPQADSGTGQLVDLVETIIEGVKDGDNASVSNQLHNIQELTDLFCSLQPGPDLDYDKSIISVTSNDGVKLSYVITSAQKLTCKVTFKPQEGGMSNSKLNSDDVVIPSAVEYDGKTYTVTRIGERAFKDCRNLKSVVIPNTVTCIENQAFYGCDSLSHMVIPESVASIGGEAFDFCSGLVSIKVDAANRYYDSRYDCNGIIETASGCMIAGCRNTHVPETVKSIGSYAFSGCKGLESIVIPNSVTSIGESAFANTGLSSIVIPESVTEIDDWTFLNCISLKEVKLPESIKRIGEYTFRDCSNLASVNIPESVRYIGVSAFEKCSGLKTITVSADTISNQAFYECEGLTDVRLTDSVCYIDRAAFAECKSLKTLTVPRKVTRLNPYFYDAGDDSNITLTLESPVPPEIDPEALPEGMTIYVPRGSKDSYRRAYRKKGYKFVERIPSAEL